MTTVPLRRDVPSVEVSKAASPWSLHRAAPTWRHLGVVPSLISSTPASSSHIPSLWTCHFSRLLHFRCVAYKQKTLKQVDTHQSLVVQGNLLIWSVYIVILPVLIPILRIFLLVLVLHLPVFPELLWYDLALCKVSNIFEVHHGLIHGDRGKLHLLILPQRSAEDVLE